MKTFTLTSLGISGPAWIKRLKKNGYKIGTYAEQVLNSPDFENHRMKKGEKLTLAIIPNKEIGTDNWFTTQQIRDYAKSKGYETPKAEVACLIREAISDDDMNELGVWYTTVFHEPIIDSGDDPKLLCASRSGDGLWLDTYWDEPGSRWYVEGASAFVVPASQRSDVGTSEKSSDALDLERRVEALEQKVEAIVSMFKNL